MSRKASRASLISLPLERSPGAPPLHQQLYSQLRQAVLDGRLAADTRLPSSRLLAEETGCSRNTVLSAYEQLTAEGYIVGRVGAGSYVSRVLPEDLQPHGSRGHAPAAALQDTGVETAAELGARAQAILARTGQQRSTGLSAFAPFSVGAPDGRYFPFDVWGRLAGRFWRAPDPLLLKQGDPAGLPELRQAIADYLGAVRSLTVSPEQIFITSGSQQALTWVCRLLLDPGDRVWIEDPGYSGFRAPLMAAGAEPCPVSVDRDGFAVEEALAGPQARLAVVAPARQFPTGAILSLARRLELLRWARATGGWIVEDDYDSEYRYAGRPLAPMQSLSEGAERVLYIGSFSKVLFSGIRMGYLVVPPALAEPLRRLRHAIEDHPPLAMQPVLAAFMKEGHFAAHVRRMRLIYAKRQACLRALCAEHLPEDVRLEGLEAGLHLLARLPERDTRDGGDRAVAERARTGGLMVQALSAYCLDPARRARQQGLLLGFAATARSEMPWAVRTLAGALGDSRSESRAAG
ncbi:PLP-dependent aminotransferase family protein [Fodinicurvata halophila]|uniref:PLP-dependent aminotransferase family protein n=1 Tax=Fodinicurvata halophila TaxID=1419723 RepID=A0ABV8UHZ0_9PROT